MNLEDKISGVGTVVGKLGKRPYRHDPRTLLLAKYLDAAKLPPIPPSINWGAKMGGGGAMLNTDIGDCAIAAQGHAIQLFTSNNGAEVTVPDTSVLAAYRAVSGYDPADPSTDVGCVELDVLRYMRTTGIDGHKIGAFALVNRDAHNTAGDARYLDHVRAAIALFGCSYIGLAMPLAWQDTLDWKVPARGPTGIGDPGGWGGHAIILGGFEPASARYGGGIFHGKSWGEEVTLTANAVLTYCDESWVMFSTDWTNGTRPAPSGVDMATLLADVSAVGQPTT